MVTLSDEEVGSAWSLHCRLQMAGGCRGEKTERDEYDFNALNQVI